MTYFSRLLTIILLILACISNFCYGKSCTDPKTLFDSIAKIHYSPRMLDDSLSNDLFNTFIKKVDPTHLHFDAKDIGLLEKYRYSLDNQIESQNCEFTELVAKLLETSLHKRIKIIESIKEKYFDYSKDETFFFKNLSADMADRNRKWIKYNTLISLINSRDSLNRSNSEENLSSIGSSKIKLEVCKRESYAISEILDFEGGINSYVKDKFLKSISSCFDPHTSFFSLSEKKIFDSYTFKEEKSFGFEYDLNRLQKLEITRVVPGGPAWKTNELNHGDVLMVLQDNSGKKYDLTFYSRFEFLKLTKQVGDNIWLTVKKKNGTITKVKLKKEIISIEDNLVKGFIIEGKRKIGLILLPGFYTDSEDAHSLGCANDLAKEIIKLKSEHIEGLIIDLRNNGGGSMREAIDLAGIFINAGPLGIYKQRNDKPRVLKDPNIGAIYTKPLVILVNEYSASASEIIASSLQDYHRALIVGNNTYGKSTGQVIIPIQSLQNENSLSNETKLLGYAKITTTKFYRLTGQTIQKKGVKPDIIIPGFTNPLDQKEASAPFALSSDFIVKKTYYTPYNTIPVESVLFSSQSRIEKDSSFIKLKKLNLDFKEYLKHHMDSIRLSLNELKNSEKKYRAMLNSFDSIKKLNSTFFRVTPPQYLSKKLLFSDYDSLLFANKRMKLSNDPILKETYFIINDLLSNEN